MSDIFISYVEEDEKVAIQIAEALENVGYTTWAYKSQGLPGHSFISQITQEIPAAKAMLLLISIKALSSKHVKDELFLASSHEKFIIPLLIGINYDEVKKRQPEWATMLGPAAAVEITRTAAKNVMPQVIKSLEAKGIRPSVKKVPEPTPPPPSDIESPKDIRVDQKPAPSSLRDILFGKRWKKLITIGIALALVVGVIIGIKAALPNTSSHIVNFTDPNLESAIRDAIGQPTGNINQSALDRLTSLSESRGNISNLTGIEHCTRLQSLMLYGNNISDISALSGLTNLTKLDLHENLISDISAVSDLTNLTYLDFCYNPISNISPLSSLTNLKSLRLGSNNVSNISALSGLTNITDLCLWYNKLSDISALSGLTSLQSIHLANNQISDISALSGLTDLTYVSFASNNISNISALSDITNLQTLSLDYNNISDFATLADSSNLQQLHLANNQIKDISALSGLTNLTFLVLSNNQINDISVLSEPTNLQYLFIDGNQISDIKPLVDNTHISSGDEVYLADNPLSTLSISVYIPQLQARGVTVSY